MENEKMGRNGSGRLGDWGGFALRFKVKVSREEQE
jgi:hypothetical protein